MSDYAPNALFDANLDLASKIGRNFPIPGLSIDEGIHEARVALWHAANTYDPARGEFEGFAAIVIRNHLRNAFEKAKRNAVEATTLDARLPVLNDPEETSGKESVPAQEADPLLEAERADIRKAIDEGLDNLTLPQRELLKRFAAGESYADIGREKGVSAAAVRQMAQRALAEMRSELESKSINVRFMPERAQEADADHQPDFTRAPIGEEPSSRVLNLFALTIAVLGVCILISAAVLVARLR
ncbi:MAG: sigma-70 family RNA polymerase sigma factor [Verrucomicrobia bacterium]|nr:sigma-70 family RNA polymerase sigma factor [Verrucomicrobiota bacterium]